jgi:hypothetical protein
MIDKPAGLRIPVAALYGADELGALYEMAGSPS